MLYIALVTMTHYNYYGVKKKKICQFITYQLYVEERATFVHALYSLGNNDIL